MGLTKVQTLSADLDILLPHLFSLLFSSEQILLIPAIESLASLVKLEAVAIIALAL